MSKHSSFHIFPNLCYCPDWPPFTVSGPSKHLSKASPPPGHQTSAFLPVLASFSPASLMFPVYSSTGYFPSAYKHAMSFHIGKKKRKKPLLTHTSSSRLSISQILFMEKPVERIVFSFSSNFSPFIVSWSHSNHLLLHRIVTRLILWWSKDFQVTKSIGKFSALTYLLTWLTGSSIHVSMTTSFSLKHFFPWKSSVAPSPNVL